MNIHEHKAGPGVDTLLHDAKQRGLALQALMWSGGRYMANFMRERDREGGCAWGYGLTEQQAVHEGLKRAIEAFGNTLLQPDGPDPRFNSPEGGGTEDPTLDDLLG